MAKLFINLPVKELVQSTKFYQAIWFTQNADFSNDDASAMVYDDTLSIMLLNHEFTHKFVPEGKVIADSHKVSEVLNALQLDSKDAVDHFFDKAIATWAKATIPTQDHGTMYGKDFEDLDGHIWEVFWMDAS